jgi:hypothetical protein
MWKKTDRFQSETEVLSQFEFTSRRPHQKMDALSSWYTMEVGSCLVGWKMKSCSAEALQNWEESRSMLITGLLQSTRFLCPSKMLMML